MRGAGDLTTIFLILLVVIDILMIIFFGLFYIKFKKIIELPWEEVKKSIDRAEELVKRLEALEKGKTSAVGIESKPSLKQEVKELYSKGLNPSQIAKKLGLSEAEVELILKKR